MGKIVMPKNSALLNEIESVLQIYYEADDWLPNDVFGDPEGTLQKIIYERLGRDCEELFTEIIPELKGMDGEDYERIADGYRGMAVDAMNGLHEVLMQPRLNRKRLEAIYDNLNKNL